MFLFGHGGRGGPSDLKPGERPEGPPEKVQEAARLRREPQAEDWALRKGKFPAPSIRAFSDAPSTAAEMARVKVMMSPMLLRFMLLPPKPQRSGCATWSECRREGGLRQERLRRAPE